MANSILEVCWEGDSEKNSSQPFYSSSRGTSLSDSDNCLTGWLCSVTRYHCCFLRELLWMTEGSRVCSIPFGPRSGGSLAALTLGWLPYPFWFPALPPVLWIILDLSVPSVFFVTLTLGPLVSCGTLHQNKNLWILAIKGRTEKSDIPKRHSLKSRNIKHLSISSVWNCLKPLQCLVGAKTLCNMTKVRKELNSILYVVVFSLAKKYQYFNHTLSSILIRSWSSKLYSYFF